ncbi:MAG TPA: hypothetical protein ENN22_12415, partial [bacterium]|nr:hypothetical protein [bacterium]
MGKIIVKYVYVFLCLMLMTENSAASDERRSDIFPVKPGVVVAKLKPDIELFLLKNKLSRPAARVPFTAIDRLFPSHDHHPAMSKIYHIHFSETVSPKEVALELISTGLFEYVEPRYLATVVATFPIDSLLQHQFYLEQMDLFKAWDFQRGSREVVIAIVDNGADYRHPDLFGNLWVNEAEASGIAGVDDDGNGYVDDIYGWDFGENNNDPGYGTVESLISVHGSHTAGIASAVTDNITGIAGVGWKCRIMVVKVSTDDDTYQIPFGYEGIVYAADNGAHIINNSWGRRGPYSQFEQDVIDYAAGKGCLIVAAGGNANSETIFYPASYTKVISVAAVNELDEKSSYSSFGRSINVSAPGGDQRVGKPGILSLFPMEMGGYGELSGTSMASPMVTGVLGLLKNHFPDWDRLQLYRQLVLTADPIDLQNPGHSGKIGFGRVNAFRALTETILSEEPAKIALFRAAVTDSVWGNNNGLFERGETIGIDLYYRNYALSPGQNFKVRLSSPDPDIIVTQNAVDLAAFPADSLVSIRHQLHFFIKPLAKPHLVPLAVNFSMDNGEGGSDTLKVLIGKSALLLVDDDNSIRNVEGFYISVLDQLRVPYLIWDHAELGAPSARNLIHFPTVIWFCEWAFPSLSAEDRFSLQYYLDHSGSLFISGQDIGWDLADPEGTENNQYSEAAVNFYRHYLHAEYHADHSLSSNVVGVPGTIGQGLQFKIYQPAIPIHFQFPDWIEPTAGALSCFRYDNARGAGVEYSGKHKVINLGFGFEAIDSY